MTDKLIADVVELRERLSVVEGRQAVVMATIAKLETQFMSIRVEVHELNENVSRSNKINLETQGEVMRLRRETQDSFHDVTDALTAIFTQVVRRAPPIESLPTGAIK